MEFLGKNEAWNPEAPNVVQDPALVARRVDQVLHDYDFLILVERYDESLVAMQLLLGLSSADILYLPSKGGGSYIPKKISRLRHGRAGSCVKSISSSSTPSPSLVEDYLHSPEWLAQNYGDFLLYAAVSKSLDHTITETLGKERFDTALQDFLQLKQEAYEACADQAMWPCGPHGEPQWKASKKSCYYKDEGCGYPCLDDFAAAKGFA
jgi:hypothetical protein